jgi:hypothetical protein
MKTPFESMMTKDEQKLLKRWTVGAAAFYGFIVAATVALVAIGINSSGGSANSEESVTNSDLEGYAVPLARTSRLSQAGSSGGAEVTTGYNTRGAPAESVNPPRAAARPIPEVDEMGKTPASPQEALVENGWDFNAPNGVPGFAPLQADSAPSAGLPQLTSRAKK